MAGEAAGAEGFLLDFLPSGICGVRCAPPTPQPLPIEGGARIVHPISVTTAAGFRAATGQSDKQNGSITSWRDGGCQGLVRFPFVIMRRFKDQLLFGGIPVSSCWETDFTVHLSVE